MIRIFYLILFSMPLVLAAQKVGIGTTSPTETLEVIGNILMDTAKLNAIQLSPNGGAGKILTSDNAGNASWENLIVPPIGDSPGNVGYGVWGDCATNGNITDYFPVADTSGAAGDFFGTSVSIDGDFAIVGSPIDDEVTSNQGSASIYHFNGVGWDFTQKVLDPEGVSGDRFGNSVSISGNFAIVGSHEDDVNFSGQGSATIFQYNGSTWDWIAKITDPNAASSDRFGISVCVSGNELMIGSYQDDIGVQTNQGSVCVFQYDGSNWNYVEKLIDPDGTAGDNFGSSVSVANNFAIIGSILDDGVTNMDQGSACIYQFNGSTWDLMQKITDSSGSAMDFFGCSVSISYPYAVAGSYADDVGSNGNQGSASVFRYNGTNWVSIQKKTNLTGAPNDFFGRSVCINGQYLLVGADGDDVATNGEQGSMTIYHRLGFGWQQLQFVSEPGGNSSDFFGSQCSLDGLTLRFMIGAPAYLSSTGKVVFGKIN